MQKRLKQERGITLIALIISVIIMVILATVAINSIYNMAIVNKAQDGVQQYAQKSVEENQMLDSTVGLIESTVENLQGIQGGNGTTEGNGSGTGNNNGGGNTQAVLKGARATAKSTYTSGTGANAKTAVIPAGFVVSNNAGEDEISEGLVIYRIPSTGTDALTDEQIASINWTTLKTASNVDLTTTYDQFVWIPIPRANINDMFMCQGKTSSTICDIHIDENTGLPYCANHSNNTNMAGRLYGNNTTGESFTPDQTNQTYSAYSGIREPAIVTSANNENGTSYDGASSGTISIIAGSIPQAQRETNEKYDTAANFLITLQDEYNAIVKSVYENEGFWVGRYETSGLNGTVKIVAGTTIGMGSQTWYTMYGKQKLYAKNQNMLGGMISGAAYDQVMKFVDGDTNYNVTSTTQVAHNLSNVYNTGSKSEDKGYNVYDLAGNVYEWTTEADSTDIRVTRGGSYNCDISASFRSINTPNDSSDSDIGTRFVLYVK